MVQSKGLCRPYFNFSLLGASEQYIAENCALQVNQCYLNQSLNQNVHQNNCFGMQKIDLLEPIHIYKVFITETFYIVMV